MTHRDESLIPHLLDAEALLAEFQLFRTGYKNRYVELRDAANRDTLQAALVLADTAMVSLAYMAKKELPTVRRRIREAATSGAASWEGMNDGE